MATDFFMDVLSKPAVTRSGYQLPPQAERSKTAQRIIKQSQQPAKPLEDVPAGDDDHGKPGGRTTKLPVTYGETRPDFADDIDRIVRELVAAGDVVWDGEISAYRAPHCKRFKFGSVS